MAARHTSFSRPPEGEAAETRGPDRRGTGDPEREPLEEQEHPRSSGAEGRR